MTTEDICIYEFDFSDFGKIFKLEMRRGKIDQLTDQIHMYTFDGQEHTYSPGIYRDAMDDIKIDLWSNDYVRGKFLVIPEVDDLRIRFKASLKQREHHNYETGVMIMWILFAASCGGLSLLYIVRCCKRRKQQ